MSAGKEASPKEPDILKVRAELLQALKGPHDESELVCAVESGAKFYNENPDDTEVGEALDWAQKRTAGRWPPKRCEMRDLSYLTSTLTTSYALNRVFGNAGLQTEPKGHAFFLNVIRLLDKTLREYGEARQYLQSYVRQPE